MHSHLHTSYNVNCEEIMTALDECHARGFMWKVFGNCNDVKREVNKCLAAERYDRAKNNRDIARSNRRKIEDIWAKERALDASAVQPPTAPSATDSSTDGAKQ